MHENDHTDAELARRELGYEFGNDTPTEQRWYAWVRKVEADLKARGITTEAMGLDGDQWEHGFSLDFAHECFEADYSPEEYVAKVLVDREEMSL